MDKARIMVVEDEGIIAHTIAKQLTDMGHTVVAIAYSGEDAVEKARELHPDLVLMDIVLAGEMDGIEAAEEIKAIEDIPVVYLTAYADEETLHRAKISGPSAYVLKPVEEKQLQVAVELALHRRGMDLNLQKNHDNIYQSMKGVIEAMAENIELRGPYTAGHHDRVAHLASALAREMGLTDFQMEGIDLASRIFDMGMINVPSDILQEDERLEGARLTLYQTYPKAAYDTLKKIESTWPIADIVLQHRELYDGSGFPRGFKGDDILIEARILAVAVAMEDMTTHRSYRNALSVSEALETLSSQSGSRYDLEIVDVCLRLFREKDFQINSDGTE